MQQNRTFLELIGKERIEIPVIQRDYAQGRDEEKISEIRSNFLGAIADVLLPENSVKPLVLDFVYGTSKAGIFYPLDGQQRLTTLFLLHWYLADEGRIEALRSIGEDDGWGKTIVSRFTYQTRISSKNFCNELLCHTFWQIVEQYDASDTVWSLSEMIKDQAWYVWDWSKDPTIAGMLVMLDEIHERFSAERDAVWQRLTEQRRVVFHLLELAEFKLTDELYVKMNARGKELSSFDILKSTLEEQMRVNKVSEHIQKNWRNYIDNKWIDLFWDSAKQQLGGEKDADIVNNIEDRYLRFLKRIMVFHLFVSDDCLKNLDSAEVGRELKRLDIKLNSSDDTLSNIRELAIRGDVLRFINLFCKTGFFDESFFNFAIGVVNGLIYKDQDLTKDISSLIQGVHFEGSSETLFERFVAKTVTFETRVQFFAVASFAKYNEASDVCKDAVLQKEFNEWMRVIRNLSTNINSWMYNTYKDLYRSIIAVNEWAEKIYGERGYGSVLEFLRKEEPKNGFVEEQLAEEVLKADLLPLTGWEEPIRQIEEHPYFLGQIRFLLDWADGNLDLFNSYRMKVEKLFNQGGVNTDVVNENLFRSALLAKGIYYMEFGGSRYSLLSGGTVRDHTWKRLLRERDKAEVLKLLLSEYDTGISFNEYFSAFLGCVEIQDWRRYFIHEPKIFDFQRSSKKVISWWYWNSGEIILLQKERTSAPHAELRTYYWQLRFGRKEDYLDSRNESHPFSAVFPRKGGDVSVKFVVGDWDEQKRRRSEGKYVVSSSFDAEDLTYSSQSNRWERSFDSHDYQKVEDLLQNMLIKCCDLV